MWVIIGHPAQPGAGKLPLGLLIAGRPQSFLGPQVPVLLWVTETLCIPVLRHSIASSTVFSGGAAVQHWTFRNTQPCSRRKTWGLERRKDASFITCKQGTRGALWLDCQAVQELLLSARGYQCRHLLDSVLLA